MKFIKAVVAAVMAMACFIPAVAVSAPDWTKGFYEDLDYTYIKTVQAQSSTREMARNKALQRVISERSNEAGVRADVRISPSGEIYVSGNDNLTVKARVIDEYAKELSSNAWEVYLLVQVAKNPTYPYEIVKVTDKYSFTPAVFVPGMAQLQKGSTAKGVLFITAEVLSVGAIVVCESQRASYESKISGTHSAQLKQDYIDKVDSWANGRNIAIAATAAFYAWNVIDGIMAKGKKHVVTGHAPQMAMAPFWSPEGQGLAMRITF